MRIDLRDCLALARLSLLELPGSNYGKRAGSIVLLVSLTASLSQAQSPSGVL